MKCGKILFVLLMDPINAGKIRKITEIITGFEMAAVQGQFSFQGPVVAVA